jgi:hypothetical protein
MNQDILNAYNEQSRLLTQTGAEKTATLTAMVDELFSPSDFEEKFVNACVKAIKSTKNLEELSNLQFNIECRMTPNFWNTATYVGLGIGVVGGTDVGFVSNTIKQFQPHLTIEGFDLLNMGADRLKEFLRLKGFTEVITLSEPYVSMIVEGKAVSCVTVIQATIPNSNTQNSQGDKSND